MALFAALDKYTPRVYDGGSAVLWLVSFNGATPTWR
jgi:hypothetical protein